MKKNIHCFIAESERVDGANNIHLNDMKNIPNGSCDYLSFNELNSLSEQELEPVIAGLSMKIKLQSGTLVLQYINMDKVVNDITYAKISIDQINQTLTNKAVFFYEDTILKIIEKHKLLLEHIIYNNFFTTINLKRP